MVWYGLVCNGIGWNTGWYWMVRAVALKVNVCSPVLELTNIGSGL